MMTTEIIGAIRRQQPDGRLNERGNTVRRLFWPSDRYVLDFADDFADEGWQQYDTDQDASYFGAWVNPRARLILTYAEGDWTLTECPDWAHYRAEVQCMNEFYGEGIECATIDADGTLTIYRQDRRRFLAEAATT